jgi:hypothetical protein
LAWEQIALFDQLKHCRASWLINILLVAPPGLDFVTDPYIVCNILQVPLINGLVKEVVLAPSASGLLGTEINTASHHITPPPFLIRHWIRFPPPQFVSVLNNGGISQLMVSNHCLGKGQEAV